MEYKLLYATLSSMPCAVILKDKKGRVEFVNDKFSRDFHIKREDIVGKTFEFADDTLNEMKFVNDILNITMDNGESYVAEETEVWDEEGEVLGTLTILKDITCAKEKSDQADKLAKQDYLTGMPNRRGLYEYYDSINVEEQKHFMFIDIDNFKIVNDVYGHSVGDEVLAMVSTFIQSLSNGAFVSRIGGDEYVMVLDGRLTEDEVVHTAKLLLGEVNKAEFREDVISTLSLSIGIILDQIAVENGLDEILYKCDVAMYQAKKSGKNQFVIYNRMEEQVRQRKRVEEEMEDALVNREFCIYLQPKVNMLTSNMYAAEALVRWIHPKDGVIPPIKFIPIFENNGFVVKLDMYVLEEVCKLKRRWKDEGKDYADMVVSVNMSRLHFFRENFVERLTQLAQNYDINPNEIEIEITESVFLDNSDIILSVVKDMKKQGFFVAIDDFGSGYSSLNMLKNIPADILKLDKEFLAMSEDDEKSINVIKNVITMTKDLKLQVVTEGVEDLEKVLFLTSCGCELAQGYYYSRPLPVPEFEQYAQENMNTKERTIRFDFNGDLKDAVGTIEGEVIGNGYEFVKGPVEGSTAIHLLGGAAHQNVIEFPTKVLWSESYTISMWVKVEEVRGWTSLFYIKFQNGFLSLSPFAWDGTMAFRIKDERNVDGWYDTTCINMAENEWVHIAITYDSRSEVARIFYNGLYLGFREHVPTMRIAKLIILGGDVYQDSFKGYISSLEVCDHSKSMLEIRQMYDEYHKDPTFVGISE